VARVLIFSRHVTFQPLMTRTQVIELAVLCVIALALTGAVFALLLWLLQL
jgi:large-conductance mechanosensitive channel